MIREEFLSPIGIRRPGLTAGCVRVDELPGASARAGPLARGGAATSHSAAAVLRDRERVARLGRADERVAGRAGRGDHDAAGAGPDRDAAARDVAAGIAAGV